jgi:hypothetical protein
MPDPAFVHRIDTTADRQVRHDKGKERSIHPSQSSSKRGADMERPLSSPNIQIIFVFSSSFLMTLQGAGGFDDESV